MERSVWRCGEVGGEEGEGERGREREERPREGEREREKDRGEKDQAREVVALARAPLSVFSSIFLFREHGSAIGYWLQVGGKN